MKWHDHLAILETTVTVSSHAKTYLIRCLEKLLVAQSGCCDVLPVAREVRDACLYVHTYHRIRIPCIQAILHDSLKLIRTNRHQRRVIAMKSAASFIRAVVLVPFLGANRTIRPPHVTRHSSGVAVNTTP